MLQNNLPIHDSNRHLEMLQKALQSGEVLDFTAPRLASSNVLDGETIKKVLLDSSLEPHPAGLSIRGARVAGNFTLDSAAVTFPIKICHSEFENPPSFKSAILSGLDLVGSKFPGITLTAAVITGDLSLIHVRSTDEIRASQIKVSGSVRLSNATVSAASYPMLDDGAPGWGRGRAMNFAGAEIAGIFNMHKAHVAGGTSLYRAKIGDLYCASTILENLGFAALNMNLITVAGNADLASSKVAGLIAAHNAIVNGNLILRNAEISNQTNEVLVLVGATIRGSALFESLSSHGHLNAFNAKFGRVSLQDAIVENEGNSALSFEGVETVGHVQLRGFRAKGCVSFHSARIGGMLDLHSAELLHQNGVSLNLGSADIGKQLLMDNVRIEGTVAAQSIHLDGPLRMIEASLISNKGPALNLSHSNISGPVRLVSAEVVGQVIMHAARIGGITDFSEAKIAVKDNAIALALDGASITSLLLRDVRFGTGTLNLAQASVDHLELTGTTRPRLAHALGWKLGTVHGQTFANGKSASEWLNSLIGQQSVEASFSAEPWKELARSFSRMGKHEDARYLLLVAAKMTTKAKPRWSRVLRAPYGMVVGYGYRSWRVIPWLAVVATASFALASLNAHYFAPTDLRAMTISNPNSANGLPGIPITGASQNLPEGYPRFSPALVALDTSIPAIGTVQASAWRVKDNELLTGTFAILKISSWALMALLLAGITGILRKD